MLQIVGMLMEYNPDVNARNTKGQSPLHIACCSYTCFRKTDIVKLLLEAKADIGAKDSDGSTPLVLAQQLNDAAVIALLQNFTN